MCSELVVAVVMEAFDVRRGNDPPDRFLFRFTLLDRAVHPLDLTPFAPQIMSKRIGRE